MTNVSKKDTRVVAKEDCFYNNKIVKAGEEFYLKAGDPMGDFMEIVAEQDSEPKPSKAQLKAKEEADAAAAAEAEAKAKADADAAAKAKAALA